MENIDQNILMLRLEELRIKLLNIKISDDYLLLSESEKDSLKKVILLIKNLESEIANGKYMDSNHLMLEALSELKDVLTT